MPPALGAIKGFISEIFVVVIVILGFEQELDLHFKSHINQCRQSNLPAFTAYIQGCYEILSRNENFYVYRITKIDFIVLKLPLFFSFVYRLDIPHCFSFFCMCNITLDFNPRYVSHGNIHAVPN